MMSAVKYYETPCQHFLIQLYDCNPSKITDFNICQRKGTWNNDKMEIQGFYMMLTVYQLLLFLLIVKKNKKNIKVN